MNAVISARGVSKSFTIQSFEKAGYRSLREDISQGFRRMLGKRAPEQVSEEFWALRDIDFEVGAGEVLGIVGRNGAGKSTLLKILSRISPPTTGVVEIRGRVGALLEVGTGFHPELTGRENIFMNGAILGMKKDEIKRKFEEIVAFSEVEKFIDTPVKHFSSGMYIRLAFAVAAHCDPDILIVDEVLAVGDAEFQKKCLGKVGDVSRKEGRTVLFVSHNMAALRGLCNRSIWLDFGRIKECGETEDVVSRYLSSSANMSNERVWDDPEKAPGNENIRWRRFSIRKEVPGEDPLLTVATPIVAEFECWNYMDGAQLNFSLLLLNFEGVRVLNTVSTQQNIPAGLFKGSCHIPAHFLNDQTYRMSIYMVEGGARVVSTVEDALVFSVHDVKRTVTWYGRWQGVVRPQFQWVLSTPDS